MAANRVKGVRATVFYGGNREILKVSREHNNANILSLGARFVSADEAKEAVVVWLSNSIFRRRAACPPHKKIGQWQLK